jgi:hypothetical protein
MKRLLCTLLITLNLGNAGMSANSNSILTSDQITQAQAKAADFFVGKPLAQIINELNSDGSYLAVDVAEMKGNIPVGGLIIDGQKIGENDVHVVIKLKPVSALKLWGPRFSFMLSFSDGICADILLVRKFAK